jgi:16S rRNA (cytidine1402-2'-O)-methyltransferase
VIPASNQSPQPSPELETAQRLPPGLYIVATPIGNLGDVTVRALEWLKLANQIACEDTRHSQRLLQHYAIQRPLLSLNEHNEALRIPQLINAIRAGEAIALVSDAGMPTVSDPGQRLVQAVIEAGLDVDVLPGASAVITALTGSGLPTVPFHFGGFLPQKKGQRSTELALARQRDCTSVYFESPYRLVDTLEILATAAPEHWIVVARELTKRFQEYARGPALSIWQRFQKQSVKGEICLIIAPVELPNWWQRQHVSVCGAPELQTK